MVRAKSWTDAEDAIFRKMITDRRSAVEIAAALDRPVRGVDQRAYRLRLSIKGRELRPASDEELRRVREMANLGWSSTRIARELGRTPTGTMSLCRRHGISLAHSLRCDGWSDDQVEKLIEMRAVGASRAAIAEATGRSVFAVARKIGELKPSKGRPRGEIMWTDEKTARLRELAPDYSAADISRRLGPGFTRNAVVGKASRLGIRIRGGSFRPGPKARVFGKAATRSFAKPKKAAPLSWQLPVDPGIREDAPRGIKEVFLALNGHDCHWPHGDPTSDDFTFCLAPRRDDAQLPYCEFHLEKSRQGSPLA